LFDEATVRGGENHPAGLRTDEDLMLRSMLPGATSSMERVPEYFIQFLWIKICPNRCHVPLLRLHIFGGCLELGLQANNNWDPCNVEEWETGPRPEEMSNTPRKS